MEINLNSLIAVYGAAITRSSALVIAMPLFGGQLLPDNFKLLLALMLAILIATLYPQPCSIEPLSLAMAFEIMKQFMIGYLLGFVVSIVTQIFLNIGQIIAMQTGLGFATMMDPGSGIQAPLFTMIFTMLANIIFLSMNGHLYLFDYIIRSYQIFPVGSIINPKWYYNVSILAQDIFVLSMSLSIPIIILLMIINASFGIISKVSPQMNIISYSFPISIMLAMLSIYFMIPKMSNLMENIFENYLNFSWVTS